jgi:hypothetical protein
MSEAEKAKAEILALKKQVEDLFNEPKEQGNLTRITSKNYEFYQFLSERGPATQDDAFVNEMVDFFEASKERAFKWMEEREHHRSKHDKLHSVLHELHEGT